MSSPDPEALDDLLDKLGRVEVEWLVLCDCTDRGEADGPPPGPEPGTCALCGSRVRAEWNPTVPDQQENPTMTNPTTDDPKEGTILGAVLGLAIVLGVGALALSLVVLALVTIWRVIL